MSRKSIKGFMEDHLDTPVETVMETIQNGILGETMFCGIRTYKSPMDAWVYQEIIWELQPRIIIEIGSKYGGSATYLSSILDVVEKRGGETSGSIVISIDKDHSILDPRAKKHSWRVKWIEGLATDSSVFDQVNEWFPATYSPRVLIIEDSSHTYENTLAVLDLYSTLQSKGDYFIVEDTIANHGLDRTKKWPRGPYEAVQTFIKDHDEYIVDRTREHFFLTWNPSGYLRRVR